MTHCTIIAEAGVNHNGDINIAKKMIEVAASAGADYVKFQTFKAEKIASSNAKKAAYQAQNEPKKDESQLEMLKKLEISERDHFLLKEYATSKNIKFLSTAFDNESVDFLDRLGIELFKIPSGEITNKPLLQHIANKRKPIILSTGMSDLKEIKNALDVLNKEGINKNEIIILHCNTEYPTPMHDVNLKAMLTIQNTFGVDVGYSDHTLGIEVPIAAVSLGAKVIEKHFTLDRHLSGPDHTASLEPEELSKMIIAIRNIERALGSGVKKPTESEILNKDIARKSIHVITHKYPGEILKLEDIIMLRPGHGISPMEYTNVIGCKVINELYPGQILLWKDLQN
jgi:N-acetylneuraminate synthase/N,N'-diacetyllegionaminate synthase